MTSRAWLPIRLFLIILITIVVAEVSVRLAVNSILKKPPLFQLDTKLGWKRIDNPKNRTENTRKGTYTTLFLGDSFIFGEGVDVDQRFDRMMAKAGYPDTLINLGVSGYSTDQEMLAAQDQLSRLREGDVLALVTFGDDFKALLCDFFAGRPKPRYSVTNGQLSLIAPAISQFSLLAEKFYLLRMMKEWVMPRKILPIKRGLKELGVAEDIYYKLLFKYLVPAAERGIKIVVLFHGQKNVDEDFEPTAGARVEYDIRRLCEQYGFTYRALDTELDRDEYRQANSVHWNDKGHQKFAEILRQACDNSSYRIHLSQKESR